MNKPSKYFYTITKDGTDFILTNVRKDKEGFYGNAVSGNGKPLNNKYRITDNEMKFARISDTYPKERSKVGIVFMAQFINNKLDKSSRNNKVWICFPTDKEAVKRSLESIGLSLKSSSDEYSVVDLKFIDGQTQSSFPTKGDISEYNYLAEMIYRMTEEERRTFDVVVGVEKHTRNVADLINLTYNTDYYKVIDNVESWDEVGRYAVEKNKIDVSKLDDLEAFIDYAQYGEYYAERMGGVFFGDMYLDAGFSDFEKKYDRNIKNIPEAYRVTDSLPPVSRSRSIELMDAAVIASSLDSVFRDYAVGYSEKYPDRTKQILSLHTNLCNGEFAQIRKLLKEIPEIERDELAFSLSVFEQNLTKNLYYIYRVKQGKEFDQYRNKSLKDLKDIGLSLSLSNYDLLFSSEYKADFPSPEKVLFENKELERRTIKSDVVVIRTYDEYNSYYYDDGFTSVPEFLNDTHETISKVEEQKTSVKSKLKSLLENKEKKPSSCKREDMELGG